MVGKVNKLILGTVQFGMDYGINNSDGKPNEGQVEEILIRAYDSGIRCLDTAEAYGNAHYLIGEFHRRHPNKRFNVISKIPQQFTGTMLEKIESYLKELHVNCLKSILFHSYDTYKSYQTAIGELSIFKGSGKLESIGVSVYTNAQLEDVIFDSRIDIIQLPFNLLDNVNLRGKILQLAKDKGKIIHTRSAYLQGLFFVDPAKSNKTFQALEKELMLLRGIVEKNKISMQKLALNYCLQQSLIDNVLIGVDNLNQLQENLADAEYVLPESIIKDINGIAIDNADILNPMLWN